MDQIRWRLSCSKGWTLLCRQTTKQHSLRHQIFAMVSSWLESARSVMRIRYFRVSSFSKAASVFSCCWRQVNSTCFSSKLNCINNVKIFAQTWNRSIDSNTCKITVQQRRFSGRPDWMVCIAWFDSAGCFLMWQSRTVTNGENALYLNRNTKVLQPTPRVDVIVSKVYDITTWHWRYASHFSPRKMKRNEKCVYEKCGRPQQRVFWLSRLLTSVLQSSVLSFGQQVQCSLQSLIQGSGVQQIYQQAE